MENQEWKPGPADNGENQDIVDKVVNPEKNEAHSTGGEAFSKLSNSEKLKKEMAEASDIQPSEFSALEDICVFYERRIKNTRQEDPERGMMFATLAELYKVYGKESLKMRGK